MHLDEIAPERESTRDYRKTVTISLTKSTIDGMDGLVQQARDKGRVINRSRAIENILNKAIRENALI